MSAPPAIPEVYHPVDLAVAPAISTPWPAPPPMVASWQVTLYELTGSVRARNDYALQPPITPGVRGVARSPLVMAAGSLGRELLVIEPERGDPVRHVALPDDVPAHGAVTFATSVDGRVQFLNPAAEVYQHVPELSEKPEDVVVLAPLSPLLRVVV